MRTARFVAYVFLPTSVPRPTRAKGSWQSRKCTRLSHTNRFALPIVTRSTKPRTADGGVGVGARETPAWLVFRRANPRAAYGNGVLPGGKAQATTPEPADPVHIARTFSEQASIGLMINSLKLLGVVTLLLMGAWGWGTAALGALRRAGWESVRDEIGPPVQMLLGVGLFLAFGGVLVAFDTARLWPLLAWHVIGVGFLLIGLVRRRSTVDFLHLRAVWQSLSWVCC